MNKDERHDRRCSEKFYEDLAKEIAAVRNKIKNTGLWDSEIDRKSFIFTHDGKEIPCEIMRNTCLVWCGYIGVPGNHPWFRMHYDDLSEIVDIHGGLTYSGQGEDGRWWLGFDCGHAGDYLPIIATYRDRRLNEIYRTQLFSEMETEKLAYQAIMAWQK